MDVPADEPPVYVQAGAFSEEREADNLKARIALTGLEALVRQWRRALNPEERKRLSADMQRLIAEQLYWIVKNGIKYTAMPAWAAPERREGEAGKRLPGTRGTVSERPSGACPAIP